MKEVNYIIDHQSEFLSFVKSKFIMIHKSNFFFRDFHYATMMFLEDHEMNTSYRDSEIIALESAKIFEEREIFKKIDHQTWTLNYPEFAIPKIEKKAATA